MPSQRRETDASSTPYRKAAIEGASSLFAQLEHFLEGNLYELSSILHSRQVAGQDRRAALKRWIHSAREGLTSIEGALDDLDFANEAGKRSARRRPA